jgi:hypothetical protein
MLRWLARKRIDAFEREFDYDMRYARELLATDRRALFTFFKVQALSRYREDVPRDVHAAAGITGTMAADCGPCTQLGVTMALRDGVDATTIANVVAKRDAALSDEVRLGVLFARATLAHAPEADHYRAEIVKRWGERALVSLAFAITASQIYPTFKYALGHGKSCQRVLVGGVTVPVQQAAAA